MSRKMKRLVGLLILFILLGSCSENKDEIRVRYENVEITGVEIPDVFIVNQTAEIYLKHKQKSTCHNFDGFYYAKDGYTRTVAIQNYVTEQSNCQTLTTGNEKTATLRFQPQQSGTYTFKFWKGKDANGNHIWETIIRDAVIN